MHFLLANRDVNRPTRNGTYIRFVNASDNATVLQYDAGWAPNMVYTGNTILIMTNYSWIPGNTYYVLFDSGILAQLKSYFSDRKFASI